MLIPMNTPSMLVQRSLAAAIAGTSLLVLLAGCSHEAKTQAMDPGSMSSELALRPAPSTERILVTDEYHGVEVADEYRWLENWDDPKVQAWSEVQNQYARSYLDHLPKADQIRARLTELETANGVTYSSLHEAGGVVFATKIQPPKQQPLIVALSSLNSTQNERIVLDPNTLDAGGHVSFDWYVPSPDGKMIAVSLSSGGSESGDVHIYDVATGQERTGDMVPRVNGGTAGGSLSWKADSSGFFYSRYPREGERPAADMMFYTQVYYHKLGTSTNADTYETGKDYPKIASVHVEADHSGQWALTNIQKGDGGEFLQDLKKPDGSWIRLGNYEDRIVEAKFGYDNALYLVSRKDAPMGKILRLALESSSGNAISLAQAKEIVAERRDGSIETAFYERTGIYLSKNRLYVQYQVGGPNELRVFDLQGRHLTTVPSLPISTVEGIDTLADGGVVFSNQSYIQPAAWYRFDPASNKATKTAMFIAEPPRMPKLNVERHMALSKDGTRVPINIITREGVKRDGKNPTVIWGYGGYGVSETPVFSNRRLLWIEQGGVFAVANIRGGGEYGEKWHREGNLLKKQNVFDDYYAACKFLVDQGYTNKDKLAIMGGSNGGLLMGATFTQHPDLCKAVVSSVGIYDMLRVELSANGEFNTTEFGTVKDADQFAALRAYSPYHRVKPKTTYPSILFMTGANDPRVDPMQSRKMTALLQSASPNSLTLLRTSGNTGHGQGTPLSARIEQNVDLYGYLMWQLGLDYQPR